MTVTWDTKKCLLSVLTSVPTKWVDQGKYMSFLTNELSVIYKCAYEADVRNVGFHFYEHECL